MWCMALRLVLVLVLVLELTGKSEHEDEDEEPFPTAAPHLITPARRGVIDFRSTNLGCRVAALARSAQTTIAVGDESSRNPRIRINPSKSRVAARQGMRFTIL